MRRAPRASRSTSYASGWLTMRWAGTSGAWGRPPDEVSPPAEPFQRPSAARSRAERAAERAGLDAFRAERARTRCALGVAGAGGGRGDRGVRAARLAVVRARALGA